MGQLENWTGNGGEREGVTCSEGPQGGIKPPAAAVVTQALYMGYLLDQLSYQRPPRNTSIELEDFF